MLILPNTDLDNAVDIAERLRNSIEQQTFVFDDIKIEFTISLGVTVCELTESGVGVNERLASADEKQMTQDDSVNPDSLSQMIKRADEGMYKAKQNGRNQTFSA